ncbi:MAG: aldehyde ferredoxin oxidoreductase N-terminal domain-containing protein [Candidatus Helarchaeota archaeon]
MEWYGYTGSILQIDLTHRSSSVKEMDPTDIQRFIGGIGMNCKLFADLFSAKTAPFSPENLIIIGTGPLVGTITPGTSRIVGISKFPASGAIAVSCGSMSFGFQMKHAGYDHIVITGQASDPVYLSIWNDTIEFCEAGSLWGQDIVFTTDYLRQQHGSCGVIAIGQAGENLVDTALTLVDKTSTFGRGGLGAIMGAKNLKAITVKGTKGLRIADSEAFKKLYHTLFERIRNYPHRKDWHKLGMLRNTPFSAILGAQGEKKKAKQVSERTYLRKLKKYRFACPSCPMGDKDLLEIKEGEFAGLTHFTSSVINPFFLLLLRGIQTYNEAVKAFDQINRYGLDSINVPALWDFCTDLYERGVLTKEATGLEWKRDFKTLMQVIDMITFRKGFGEILAGSWRKLAELYEDIEKDMLVVKGLEQVFEPRYMRLGTMEFEQIVNPKGAHVASGGSPTYMAPGRPITAFEKHFHRMGIPPTAFDRIYSPPYKEMGLNIGRLTRYAEDWYTILTSQGICARAQMNRFWGLTSVTAFYNAVTGFHLTSEDLRIAAERTWNLLKLLNAREGFARKDDTFPSAWFTPLQFGDLSLKFQDFYGGVQITSQIANQLLDDYYDERGWDKVTGLPTRKKIEDLGLSDYF